MKLKNLLLLSVSLCMLFNACDNDDSDIFPKGADISDEVRNDINKRFTSFEIKQSYKDSNEYLSLSLIDENNNTAELRYKANVFQAEYRKITFQKLPEKVQEAFSKLAIRDITNDLSVYKTERSYLKYDLYTFHFLQTTSTVTNLVYRIFITEDGTVLSTINRPVNDDIMLYANYIDQFNYIEENYPGADVRYQLNDEGCSTLVMIHDNYTKFVYFLPDSNDHLNWKSTKYEVSLDYSIPTNVLSSLKEIDPLFTYTNIVKIETPTGNQYNFMDYTRKDKGGYIISE